MGICSVDLDATDQLLIIYCAFFKFLKTKNYSEVAIYRLQESLYVHLNFSTSCK
jgi:hypothetical protein